MKLNQLTTNLIIIMWAKEINNNKHQRIYRNLGSLLTSIACLNNFRFFINLVIFSIFFLFYFLSSLLFFSFATLH